MARGVNKVILIGALGRDPEVRYLTNGSAVVSVSLATGEQWKDKNTGEKQEKTEWHNLVVYGKLAEIVGQFCRKGSKVFVEGKIQTRKWQDKESGADRYTTEIIVREVQMLDSRKGDEGDDDNSDSMPASEESTPASKSTPAKKPFNPNEFDDIPF